MRTSQSEEYHRLMFGYSVVDWLFPFITMLSWYYFQNELHFVSVMFSKFQCLLLINSCAIHVDTKHKRKQDGTAFHHFGISVRVEKINEKVVDENCVVLDAFIAQLTENTFYTIFDNLLNNMNDYGINTKLFIDNLEAIIADFSLPQHNGIKKAIKNHLRLFHDDHMEDHVQLIFKGCYFHYKQSVARVKKLLSSHNKKKFENFNEVLCHCNDEETIKEQFNLIEKEIPFTKNWCRWWSSGNVLKLLHNCLKGKECYTNNNIENIHSNYFGNEKISSDTIQRIV